MVFFFTVGGCGRVTRMVVRISSVGSLPAIPSVDGKTLVFIGSEVLLFKCMGEEQKKRIYSNVIRVEKLKKKI